MPLQPIDISPLGKSPEIDYQAASTPDLGQTFTPLEAGVEAIGSAWNQDPLSTLQRFEERYHDSSPSLDYEQANQQFSVQGPTPELSLSWKPGETVQRDTAAQQAQLMRERIWTQFVQGHAPNSWETTGAIFAGDTIGTMVDPLNIASSFVPVGWLGRGAEAALSAVRMEGAASFAREAGEAAQSSLIGRTSSAALQNAAGIALMQPLYLATAADDHEQFSFASAANNVLFGGLLGGALHLPGEALGAFSPAVARATARAAGTLEPTETIHPQLVQDMASTSREQVIADLSRANGVAPTEPQIESEMASRTQELQDNVRNGKYQPPAQDVDDQTDLVATMDRHQKALDSGDYAQAAEVMRGLSDQDEKNLSIPLSPEEKEEINAPVERASKIRSLMDDFSACVSEAVAA